MLTITIGERRLKGLARPSLGAVSLARAPGLLIIVLDLWRPKLGFLYVAPLHPCPSLSFTKHNTSIPRAHACSIPFFLRTPRSLFDIRIGPKKSFFLFFSACKYSFLPRGTDSGRILSVTGSLICSRHSLFLFFFLFLFFHAH